MHLEEQLAALIAALNANTRSNDDLAKLMRVAAVADAPAPAKTTRAKKETPAAPEPEPTPEPEPETPADEVAPEPEAEKDDIDWIAKAKDATVAFRRDNPEKRAGQVAKLNAVFNEFGVDKISAVPVERGEEFYNKLLTTFD